MVDAEDLVHFRGELEATLVVVVVCEIERGGFGDLGTWEAFLGSDQEFLSDGSSGLEADPEEAALESSEVHLGDVVLAFDGAGVVLGIGVVADDELEIEEGFVLAIVFESCESSEVVSLCDVGCAGAFVLFDPA